MKTRIKKSLSVLLIWLLIIPPDITRSANTDIVYPLQQVSKLECRYDKFSDLDSSCKENLPILHTSDYQKYANLNDWYNDYTRRYTVLWWASYTYWWDQWNWWHMWVDIATSEWTPVYAMAQWEVIIAQNKLDFWNLVSIKHTINGKKIVSNYAHLSKIEVKVWDKVNAWDKIWEVWSTWNSTWNHLHFQIDIATNTSPAYYSYDTCPYTYNEISEKWVCFNELQNLTVDPLAFLETSWAMLNNIVIKEVTVKKSNNSTSSSAWKTSWYIFNTYVYPEAPKSDIKEVQRLFTDLGYYNWAIDWNYSSISETIISYQLNKWIIASRNEDWAGYFWPKTRAQTKADYDKYLASKATNNSNASSSDTVVESVVTAPAIKKISSEWMMTREQIEAKEIQEFKQKHNIKIEFKDLWNSVWIWETKKIWVTITDKKWKLFNWNTPYPINFIVDSSVLDVFPNKFFNFTDWKREITLTWKKTWNTTLYVKMWNETLQSFNVTAYNSSKNIYAKSSINLVKSNVVLWDTNLWAIMFKDEKWTRLLNVKYAWQYVIKTEWNAKICVKSWNVSNIKSIMNTNCSDDEYVSSKTITYDDTISWILLFNYKVFDKQAKIKVYSYNDKKDLVALNVKTTAPKWLTETYAYYDDVMNMLESWIASSSLNQWYFLEKRSLSEKDANEWIKNTLLTIKSNTVDRNILAVINSNIDMLNNEWPPWYTYITRKDFLDKVYKYLVFNKTSEVSIKYRDLPTVDNIKANSIFDKTNTWKDRFWDNYYQPTQQITRWEWAYVLSLAIDKTKNLTLTINK